MEEERGKGGEGEGRGGGRGDVRRRRLFVRGRRVGGASWSLRSGCACSRRRTRSSRPGPCARRRTNARTTRGRIVACAHRAAMHGCDVVRDASESDKKKHKGRRQLQRPPPSKKPSTSTQTQNHKHSTQRKETSAPKAPKNETIATRRVRRARERERARWQQKARGAAAWLASRRPRDSRPERAAAAHGARQKTSSQPDVQPDRHVKRVK